MKKIIFIVAILCLGYASVGFAQAPAGNYQETCRQCQMDHGNLYCICQTRRGYWQRTHLNIARKCTRAQNVNGELVCKKWSRVRPAVRPAPRPEPRPRHRARNNKNNNLPAGNYRQSCNQCSWQGGTLSCRCQKANGKRVNSVFRGNCPGTISNRNGALICNA